MDQEDLGIRAPRYQPVTISRAEFLDGVIEIVELRPLRARIKGRTVYRAIPGNKKPVSGLLSSKHDAQRWITECSTGGNLNGFIHEISKRRFR